ncbi:MAG: YkvA family protein [Bellilinea sp.]
MAKKISSPSGSYSPGFFGEIALRIKLVLRLMADPRVNVFVKLLPFASIIYFFLPDLVIGPLDDAAVLGIAFSLFVELCPPDVVEEHIQRLRAESQRRSSSSPDRKAIEEDIIEGEYYEIKDVTVHENGHKEEREKR